jgi:hypothetical protein
MQDNSQRISRIPVKNGPYIPGVGGNHQQAIFFHIFPCFFRIFDMFYEETMQTRARRGFIRFFRKHFTIL